MNTNIIKSARYFLIVLLITFSFSCSNLEEDPESFAFATPATFYSTQTQIEGGLAGAMNRVWNYWEGYGYDEGAFVNDDQLDGGNLVIGDENGDVLWEAHYGAIMNLNAILRSIKDGSLSWDPNMTPETIDPLVAQAKFLRGFNYFYLVRMFGGVPLITEDTPDPSLVPMPRAAVAEVYALIIEDLTFAEEFLPEVWEGRPGRPNRYAAKGLLAKVHLTMAGYPLSLGIPEYTLAMDKAWEVINSGNCSLIQNCEDVFKSANKYSSEILFSFNSTYDDLATEPQIWVGEDYGDGGWGDKAADPYFEQNWPAQPRKDAYLLTDWNGLHYTEFFEQTPFFKKFFFYISMEDFNGGNSEQNIPLLRYADVLMIYAEAANQVNGGPTAEAEKRLDEVIARANGYTVNADHPLTSGMGLSLEQFEDRVLKERSWELCAEFDRWFDIVRKRILDSPSVTYREEDLINFSLDDYLFPIPEIDQKLNPLLEQNPGYTDFRTGK